MDRQLVNAMEAGNNILEVHLIDKILQYRQTNAIRSVSLFALRGFLDRMAHRAWYLDFSSCKLGSI